MTYAPGMHPSTAALLRFFEYEHLPPHLQEVSKPFGTLASYIAHAYDGAEATVGLRKLLEAKDCIVRAAVEKHRAENPPPPSRRPTDESPSAEASETEPSG